MTETKVIRPSGPGSLDIGIRISLQDLRNQLGAESHPLANVPQWNGDKFYMVECQGPTTLVLLIATSTEERAKEMALANANNIAKGQAWQVISCQEVELNPGKGLQACVKVHDGLSCTR